MDSLYDKVTNFIFEYKSEVLTDSQILNQQYPTIFIGQIAKYFLIRKHNDLPVVYRPGIACEYFSGYAYCLYSGSETFNYQNEVHGAFAILSSDANGLAARIYKKLTGLSVYKPIVINLMLDPLDYSFGIINSIASAGGTTGGTSYNAFNSMKVVDLTEFKDELTELRHTERNGLDVTLCYETNKKATSVLSGDIHHGSTWYSMVRSPIKSVTYSDFVYNNITMTLVKSGLYFNFIRQVLMYRANFQDITGSMGTRNILIYGYMTYGPSYTGDAYDIRWTDFVRSLGGCYIDDIWDVTNLGNVYSNFCDPLVIYNDVLRDKTKEALHKYETSYTIMYGKIFMQYITETCKFGDPNLIGTNFPYNNVGLGF